jgi:transcriptional regulator with XRE-family HTH domain
MVESLTRDSGVSLSPHDLQSLVGNRIRAARRERGLTLAQLGGEELSRSFLSSVEHGRSSISLRSLALVAARLELPVSYFVESSPNLDLHSTPTVDHAEAALAYSRFLRSQGRTEQALEYALWAARARLERNRTS